MRVSIATDCGLDRQGVRCRSVVGAGFLCSSHHSDRFWGAPQLPIQWVLLALSLGVKGPGHEADHSPPSSAKVKNTWIYTSGTNFFFLPYPEDHNMNPHRDEFHFFYLTQKTTTWTHIGHHKFDILSSIFMRYWLIISKLKILGSEWEKHSHCNWKSFSLW
jgi:hypothetical protein